MCNWYDQKLTFPTELKFQTNLWPVDIPPVLRNIAPNWIRLSNFLAFTIVDALKIQFQQILSSKICLHSNLGKIKAVEVSISILMSTNFKELKSNFGLIKVGFQKGTN